jgi:hypothetical protein
MSTSQVCASLSQISTMATTNASPTSVVADAIAALTKTLNAVVSTSMINHFSMNVLKPISSLHGPKKKRASKLHELSLRRVKHYESGTR